MIYESSSLRSMHRFWGAVDGSYRLAENPQGGKSARWKTARRITRETEHPRTEKVVKTVCRVSICSSIFNSTGGLENPIGLIINSHQGLDVIMHARFPAMGLDSDLVSECFDETLLWLNLFGCFGNFVFFLYYKLPRETFK